MFNKSEKLHIKSFTVFINDMGKTQRKIPLT